MRYAFGECQLDAARRSLTRAGRERSLQPKVLNLLIFLVQHRGRVASRQLLFQELWPAVAVSEALLTRRVTEARRAGRARPRARARGGVPGGDPYRASAQYSDAERAVDGVSGGAQRIALPTSIAGEGAQVTWQSLSCRGALSFHRRGALWQDDRRTCPRAEARRKWN
jgi:hypothetical protein